MKTPKYIIALFSLIAFLFLGATIADAQVVYGASIVGYDTPDQEVYGASTTYLDYVAGEYYDPIIVAELYRTGAPATLLDSDEDVGFGWWDDAYVELESSNYVPGSTYCTLGEHIIRGFYQVGPSSWWDPWGYGFGQGSGEGPWGGPYGFGSYIVTETITVGYTFPCITIPLPPTPTPTPTPDPCDPEGANLEACSTPTPTPTPTPQPSPTVKIVNVGFTGDVPIRVLEDGGDYYEDKINDGTIDAVPTWADDDNPNTPVAYAKDENLKVFANFSIEPSVSTPISAKIRIRKGNTELTPSPYISVLLSGATLRVPEITIANNLLGHGQFVRKRHYEFIWEISYDGTNWKSLGDKSEHDVHWLNSRPTHEQYDDFKPFKDYAGREYIGLYKEALDWSTGKLNSDISDLKAIAQRINQRFAEHAVYNPGRDQLVGEHPLVRLDDPTGSVCDDNARMFSGLLKSIGLLGVEIKFHWGGEASTEKMNYFCAGGACPSPTSYDNRASMQTSRGALLGSVARPESVPQNPAFRYHATVSFDGKSFDPSYGIVENGLQILRALKIESGQPPVCKRNAEAQALLLTKDVLRDRAIANNNSPGTVCSLASQSHTADVRTFRFDGPKSWTQKAMFNQSDGKWHIQDEFGDIKTIQGLRKGGWVSDLTVADYDGDGLADPGQWETGGSFSFLASSSDYQFFSWPLPRPRESGEKLVPGDYDGDGISDIAVWRGSDGRFTYWKSSNNWEEVITYWGGDTWGDIPTPGDFDGDGKTDIAIFRTSTGDWWVIRSSNASSYSVNWGIATDIPVPADYDGDGITDIAVVRPSDGVWYTLESGNNNAYRGYSGPTFGSNDWPVPTDYDGDGRIDFGVWFASTQTWSIGDSKTLEVRTDTFGRVGKPVPAMNVLKP